jgi:hypothetical protein
MTLQTTTDSSTHELDYSELFPIKPNDRALQQIDGAETILKGETEYNFTKLREQIEIFLHLQSKV